MAVGLRVRNNGNILQIDGTYQNMELVATGTVAMNTDDNNNGRYADVFIPAGVNSPVLAVRTDSEGVYVIRYTASNFRVYVGGRTDGKVVTYYMFGEPTQNYPRGIVGLIVRNESTGQIVYNSNKKYLRVLQPIIGGFVPDNSLTYNYPGRVVATIQSVRPWQRFLQTGGTQQQPIFVITLKSGTMRNPDVSTVNINFRTYNTLTGFGGGQQQADGLYECNYTVIDVTGY